MCSSYQAVQSAQRLARFFGVSTEQSLTAGNEAKAAELAASASAKDTYPLHLAPFIRLQTEGEEGGKPVRVAEQGQFGLMPHFATETAFGRKTYNARSETVDSKPSFRDAWKRGQRCIVPAELIYEPNWETGKAERWAIRLPGEQPMGIAGVYARWRAPNGRLLWTFAMLTVNADGHPVMQRFHRPEDEKRMVVILRPEDYEGWLTCRPVEAKGYLRRYEGPLEASPALLESQRRPR
jgi:putative SOS response-associated peptidase YedK